jgi:hypothetical protein
VIPVQRIAICNKENHPGTEHKSVNFDKADSELNLIPRLGTICIQVQDPFHVNHLLIPCSMAFHLDLAHKPRYCGKVDSESNLILRLGTICIQVRDLGNKQGTHYIITG